MAGHHRWRAFFSLNDVSSCCGCGYDAGSNSLSSSVGFGRNDHFCFEISNTTAILYDISSCCGRCYDTGSNSLGSSVGFGRARSGCCTMLVRELSRQDDALVVPFERRLLRHTDEGLLCEVRRQEGCAAGLYNERRRNDHYLLDISPSVGFGRARFYRSHCGYQGSNLPTTSRHAA